MTRNSLTHNRLTPAAQGDLEDIWVFTAQTWSVDQADQYAETLEEAFDRLLVLPEMARERRGFDPPVRVHPSAEHIIVYRIKYDHIAILRILGGRQNWLSILRMVDQ